MAAEATTFGQLAIVGMEAAWEGCGSLDALERIAFSGGSTSVAPAGEPAAPLTAQSGASLRRAARAALLDAGLDVESGFPLRAAVLFACWAPWEAEPDKAVLFPWADQTLDLSASKNPLVDALTTAQELLSSGVVDMVVFSAAAGQPSPVGQQKSTPPVTERAGFGFDQGVHGWRFGSGAGAVVWMDAQSAARQGHRVYALIQSVAFASPDLTINSGLPTPPTLEDMRLCCRLALEAAGCPADQVGYVEASACGVDGLDGIEIAGVVQVYRQAQQDLTAALGSAQAYFGYLSAAAGLAGLIQASLALYHRVFPAAPGWTGPKLPALWRGAPFYVPAAPRAWFRKEGGPARAAAVSVMGLGGSAAHLVLKESGHPEDHPRRGVPRGCRLAQQGIALLPLAGDNLDDLLDQLSTLRRGLAFDSALMDRAWDCWQGVQENADAPYAVSIVARSREEAEREIELALKSLPGAFDKAGEWQTPAGSAFTAAPAGRLGGVALVYPGAFNTYPGVAQDLFSLFPELHQRAAQVTGDIGGALNERMVYPRRLAAMTKEELAACEARLLADPIAMLTSGTAITILYTHILQQVLGIQPAAAFGYSLGENSMMYATGVWAQGEQAAERLAQSDVFRTRLAGPRLAIRESWGMNGTGGEEAPLWSNFLVMAPPEKVLAALESEPRVYLTHVNTPRQVVIGGDPEGCQRVLASLRASSLQAPFDYALHCAPMRSELEALAELHTWPVEKPPALRMYSAADYDLLPVDSAGLAQKIARMLTMPLDFPRLVQRVYADGARVFIEAGAGSNCARWISETLKGSPHLAIAMDRRGSDDASTLVRTAARLFSHRVPMDLSALFISNAQKVKP